MTDIVALTMPRWGLTMDEGLLTEWFAAVGDPVSKGIDIVEIESTKLAGTVEAPANGILRRQIAEVGQTVPCGALLGVIAGADVAEADIDAFADNYEIIEEAEGEEEAAGPQTVMVGGLPISYLRKGAGTPLLFIHGFGGDASGWAMVQDGLAADYDTIALDLPGHGASTKSVADGSLEAQAATVADFLAALGTGPVGIVAHSMGGGIALALAAARPDLVRALLLLAPMGLTSAINTAYLADFVGAEKHRDLGRVLQTLFADENLVSRAMIDEVQRLKRVDGAREALETIRADLVEGGAQAADLSSAAVAFTGPLRILWGAEDRIIVPADLPELEIEMLAAVGHMPQAEAAAKVIDAARRTLPR